MFQEELADRPIAATILRSISEYSNTIPAPTDPDAKSSGGAPGGAPAGGARMGTLIGCYLPCIQNIFGVILFIRLTWVVGTAGAVQGFLIVLTCCCVVSIYFGRFVFANQSKKPYSSYLGDVSYIIIIVFYDSPCRRCSRQ